MPQFKNPISQRLYSSLLASPQLIRQEVSSDSLSELMLSIAHACNLGCTYCFADQGKYGTKKNALMTFNVAKKAIDVFLDSSRMIKSIKFFGGEPLMNFDLIKRVCNYFDLKKKSGEIEFLPVFTMVTNMTLLPDEFIDYALKYRFLVTASLDGPPEVNDAYRQFHNRTGSFEVVDQNIQKIRPFLGKDLRLEAAFNPLHMERGMTMVDVYRYLFERYYVENILIHPMVDNSFYTVTLDSKAEATRTVFSNEMYNESFELGRYQVGLVAQGKRILEVGAFLKDLQNNHHTDAHCGLGVDRINVGANGDVNPCYTLTNQPEFTMANVLKDSVLEATRYRQIQERFLRNQKSENPVCAKCDILSTCNSCPGIMHHQYGSTNQVVPLLCDFYVGKTEGMLIGINEICNSQNDWENFLTTCHETLQEFEIS